MKYDWQPQHSGEWNCQGVALSLSIIHIEPSDYFEHPYHAELADGDGEVVKSLPFRSLEGAQAWAQSEDLYACARDLSDQSAEAEWLATDALGAL